MDTPPPNALLLTLTTPPSPSRPSPAPSHTLTPPTPTPRRTFNALSIAVPGAGDHDVFLSPSTGQGTGKKRPALRELKLASAGISRRMDQDEMRPLPSPLYRDIEARHGDNNNNGYGHMNDISMTEPTAFRIPGLPITPPNPGARLAPPQATKKRAPPPAPLALLPPTPTSPHAPLSPSLCPLPPSPSPTSTLYPASPISYTSPDPSWPLPPTHALSPSFLSRYALLPTPLGSGGFGFVLLARALYPLHNNNEVAVKFIIKDKVPPHGWGTDPILGIVPVEVVVLRAVQHEGIVRFVDFFEDAVYFYLVQELHGTPWTPAPTLVPLPPTPTSPSYTLPPSPYVYGPPSPALLSPPGSAYPFPPSYISPTSPTSPTSPSRPPPPLRRASYDLFECIEAHTRLSEPQARYIFAQVVRAVQYLHVRGICHRDIKDENILIDADFRVKLIDFGSCTISDPRLPPPYHTRFFGTLNFASPEILLGHPYRALHAEIWTLGILLHILVTGASPFATTQDAINGTISESSKKTHRMSEEVHYVMRGCLAVDPDERWTIEDLAGCAWLDGALDGPLGL